MGESLTGKYLDPIMAENKRVMPAQCSDILPDRLSLLPDDILIYNILSLLPTEEAARTSILAHRWRFLWLCLPSLDLDASRKVALIRPIGRGKLEGGKVASEYAKWVDRVISGYRGSAALSCFRVRFRLDDTFSHKIDSWLNFALVKGVQMLELDCYQNYGCYVTPYTFPSVQPHLLPNLRLLKSLSLKDVFISTDCLEHLLLESEFLERLHMSCTFVSSTTLKDMKVNVTGPMSRLKYIDISDCTFVRSIMISAPTPDLVSFKYPDRVNNLHIEHAPRLVDLFISGFYRDFDLLFHPLFRYISQLQSLRLNTFHWHMVPYWLPHLPDLSGLKHLSLTLGGVLEMHGLHEVTSLIKAAPYLEHLTLEVDRLDDWLIISKESANLQHQFLRVIEFVRFTGRKVEYGLAAYLIKGVVSLQKVIVDCRNPLIVEGCTFSRSINREIRGKRESASELNRTLPSELKQMLPSEVQLEVIQFGDKH